LEFADLRALSYRQRHRLDAESSHKIRSLRHENVATWDPAEGHRDVVALRACRAIRWVGVAPMKSKWIFSSTLLPDSMEPVEFLVEELEQSIHGTFADGVFHSRWTDYDTSRVASWRESADDPSVAPNAIPKEVRTGGFRAMLKRVTSVFTDKPSRSPIATAHGSCRAHAAAADLKPSGIATTRCFDSNQMSS
jgi:hypothetical protein